MNANDYVIIGIGICMDEIKDRIDNRKMVEYLIEQLPDMAEELRKILNSEELLAAFDIEDYMQSMDEKFVDAALNSNLLQTIPLTFSHSFGTPMVVHAPQTKLLIEQRQVIEEIAKQGRDCVIVGRNADVILNDLNPFNIFVCAEMDAKIKRCRERADHDEQLSDKALKKNIQRIDKNRARTRFLIADGEWGHRKAYHLIVNTTDWDLGELAHSVADMVKRWAKQQTKE